MFKTTREKKLSMQIDVLFTNVLCVNERPVEQNPRDWQIMAIENPDLAKMHKLHHYQHEPRSEPDVHYFHHENYMLENMSISSTD